jgi:hypothetical protein
VLNISLPLAKSSIAQPPFEVVTVIWVLLAVFGAVTVTVRVVEPDPVEPEFTVGVTDTVQAGLEVAAVIVIKVFGGTPVQLKPQDWAVTEAAATVFENDGGVIFPPHGCELTIPNVGAVPTSARMTKNGTANASTFAFIQNLQTVLAI